MRDEKRKESKQSEAGQKARTSPIGKGASANRTNIFLIDKPRISVELQAQLLSIFFLFSFSLLFLVLLQLSICSDAFDSFAQTQL